MQLGGLKVVSRVETQGRFGMGYVSGGGWVLGGWVASGLVIEWVGGLVSEWVGW